MGLSLIQLFFSVGGVLEQSKGL